MRRLKEIIFSIVLVNPVFLVNLIYGDFWKLRESCLRHNDKAFRAKLYYAYLDHYGAWIGLGARICTPPILPHGLYGIFVSDSAIIGKCGYLSTSYDR